MALARSANDVSTVLIDAAALGYAAHSLPNLREDQRWGVTAATSPDRGALRLWVDRPVRGRHALPVRHAGPRQKLSDLLNEAQVPIAERALTPVVRTSPGGGNDVGAAHSPGRPL